MTKKTTSEPEIVDSKELAPVKARISKAEAYAAALVIKDEKDQSGATAALSELNRMGDDVTARKEQITKPLNAALASTRALFKPLEDGIGAATRIIKHKLITYHDEQEKAKREAEQKLADRVERGTMKPETAARKIDEIAPVAASVQTSEGAIQYKKVSVARITKAVAELTDAQIVAHARAGYIVWDEVKARKAALAAGTEGEVLAGVTVTVETQAANTR